ncbi:MAG: hypothetical protein ABWX59_01730 [Microbacteriaceae bacterium]
MISAGIELTIQLLLISVVGVGLTASVITFVMMHRRLARIEEALGLREPGQTSVSRSAVD